MNTSAIVTPGAILGYRKDGRPIRLIAGGSGEGDPAPDTGTATDPNTGDPTDDNPPADDKPDPPVKGKDGDADSDDVATWKKRARTQEDRAKANKQALDKAQADSKATLDAIAQALGLKSKDEDPKALAEKLTTELGGAQTDARQARVELAVYKAAAKHGGDADALLDSRAFVKAVGELDPADDGFAGAVGEAIKTAIKANAKLAAAPPAEKKTPPRSGGEIPGAPGGGSKRPSGGLAGAISNHYTK